MHHQVKGASFFFLWVGGKGFQVEFVVESGLSFVHYPLGQWIVDFSCKPFFLGAHAHNKG